MEDVEGFLDWLVWMNIQHYSTTATPDYIPTGVSHFYLFGSPDRFTSKEMIEIYNGEASGELSARWRVAVVNMSEHVKR